jgi:hypothetical protein
MSDIGNTLLLWIVNRHGTFLVLAPGPAGTPEPVYPSPILHRTVYRSIYEASGDLGASSVNLGDYATLLAKLPSADGPPAQIAILFPSDGEEPISYVVDGRSFLNVQARRYRAAGPARGYGWEGDITSGHPGYFLIGSAQEANLWRVTRVEVDYANRYNFTLVPMRLTNGLPTPNFTSIANQTVRQEIEQHWLELQDAIASHRYCGVVTSAKNAAEALLYYFLLAGGHISPGNRSLADLLKKLDAVLSDPATKGTVPLDALSLYLIHKLRILHGRTHVGRVVTDGRSIAPELGLTAATDLVEVLRVAGIVK